MGNLSARCRVRRSVQVSDAFQTTFSSLAVGMDRWASINDFRSVVRRLGEWEAHLAELAAPTATAAEAGTIGGADPPSTKGQADRAASGHSEGGKTALV